MSDNKKVVHHDPVEDAKQQLKSLNVAIKQHEGDEKIQESLRKQKYQIGEFIEHAKNVEEHQHETKDGGNVIASTDVHAGSKSDEAVDEE